MKLTIQDIACMANVSKATVSRVINNKPGVGETTRIRVQQIIRQHQYNPNVLACGINTTKTKTVGIILPDIINPFFPELVRAIEIELRYKDYSILLCCTDAMQDRERRAVSNCISKHVDGIIFASSSADLGEVRNILTRYEMPCVYVDRATITSGSDAWVFMDNEYGAFLVTDHLISMGNQGVAFIAGPKGISTAGERLQGYYNALQYQGIEPDENIIFYGDYSLKSGEVAAEYLLSHKHFTALFAANDMMAIGAMKVLKRHGVRIPQDVEVMGFDNIATCEVVEPTLSTVEQPLGEMGRTVVQLLMDIMDGGQAVNKTVRISPHLIFRASTRTRPISIEEENYAAASS